MTLWDKLEKIRMEHLEEEINVQLFYNNFKITDCILFPSFRMVISLDILNLPSTKYDIEDRTVETTEIKAPIRYIDIHIKKEVFE